MRALLVFLLLASSSFGQAPQLEESLDRRVERILRTAPRHQRADLALAEYHRDHAALDDGERWHLLSRIAREYSMPLMYHADAVRVYRMIIENTDEPMHAKMARRSIFTEYVRANRPEAAAAVLREFEDAQVPCDSEPNRMAALLSELGRHEEAEQYCRVASPPRSTGLGNDANGSSNFIAEHDMRVGEWERALAHWNTDPQMEFPLCALGAEAFRNVWLELKKATCLRALQRNREALSQLDAALAKQWILLGTAQCAALAVDLRLELGEAELIVDPGPTQPAGQLAFLLLRGRQALASQSGEEFCELLLLSDEAKFDEYALRTAKRELIRLAIEREARFYEVARSYVGAENDRWICTLLAFSCDERVVGRVRNLVDGGLRGWELDRWLSLLVVLNTDSAYDLLRELSQVEEEALRLAAESLLRRQPQGWPLPPLDRFLY